MRDYRKTSGGIRIIVLSALAAVLLLALGFWLGLPRYRQWKEQRFLRQAHSFLQQSRQSAAWISAQQAFRLNRTNVETLRLMATIAEKGKSPQAISFRRKVVELQPAVLSNRLAWVQTALLFEPPPYHEAAKAIGSIDQAGNGTVEFHFASAALALKRGQLTQAEQHFEEAIKLVPANEQARLNLAVLRLRSKDEKVRAAAQNVLEEIRGKPENRLSVLRSLVAYCRDTQQLDKALSFSSELLAMPGVAAKALTSSDGARVNAPIEAAEWSDKLMHLEILHASRSLEFEGRLGAFQQEALGKPGHIYELAGWLRAHGLADRALTWLQGLPKAAQSEHPIPLAIAELHAARKEWRELEKFLRQQSWEHQDHIRFAMLAYSLRQQNDKEVSEIQWLRAVKFAEDRLDMLTVLARMAATWGWHRETEELLLAIVAKHPGETWALQSLYRAYLVNGNTAGLEKVFRALVRQDPNDLVAKNNLAVVSFLLGSDMARAHELAREVHEKDPKNHGFTSTFAYSSHLQGKTVEALKVFEGLSAAALEEPSNAAYYGLVLAAAGEKEKALKYLAIGERAAVLPEEKKLAAAARQKL